MPSNKALSYLLKGSLTEGETVSHTVRTTNEPEVEREVDDAEFLDLTRLGLILDTKATTPEGARKAAEKQLADNSKEN